MKLLIHLLSSFLTLSSLSSANPEQESLTWQPQHKHCLQPQIAEQIITQFSSLLTAFNRTTASSLLSPTNFTDVSDSINFLANIPLGATTFPSASAFIAGQGAQPPIGFQVLAVDAVTCDGVIVFRWIAEVVPGKPKVKGIDVLNVVNEGDEGKVGQGGWRITRVWSEFNSAVWVLALGGECKVPSR